MSDTKQKPKVAMAGQACRDRSELEVELLNQKDPLGPQNNGTLELIVRRPAIDKREVCENVEVTKEGGVVGDRWRGGGQPTTKQVCATSVAAMEAVGGKDRDKWVAAGDQLYLNLALDRENLKEGDCIKCGDEVVFQVSPKAHNGCKKFSARYGADALSVFNSEKGKFLRLR